MTSELTRFKQFRAKMNKRILESENKEIQRFFALDKYAYQEGALPAETKELLGLVASLALRCNDCVTYHLIRCVQLGLTNEQLYEALNVGLLVGGSIVIPHLRKSMAMLDEIRKEEKK
ncbi:MAG: carboxymuconolactone decarboxylase family protein [Candidatus Aminicenantes bacterium]|nr:carboxymuconolactone decarboxylase family protein [Candidatus Aminicenantes bacterium]